MKNFCLPSLGAGAGLRIEHAEVILRDRPPFKWFEIIIDNFLDHGGYAHDVLAEIVQQYPVIGHGVCLSIGSTDPLNISYLKKVKQFLQTFRIPWTSDHLCMTMVDHENLNDLIPLPFTREAIKHVVERVRVAQRELEVPFLLENVTRYMTLSDREMDEAAFISEIVEQSGCGLLLDLTNVYLNSQLHRFDPYDFVAKLPLDRVGQIHLAGWKPGSDGEIIDSHDAPVDPKVWELFQWTISKIGPTSTLIEWDSDLPTVEELYKETLIAQEVLDRHGSEQGRTAEGW